MVETIRSRRTNRRRAGFTRINAADETPTAVDETHSYAFIMKISTYVTGQPASHTNATDETSAAADETSAAADETHSHVFLPYWALLP